MYVINVEIYSILCQVFDVVVVSNDRIIIIIQIV